MAWKCRGVIWKCIHCLSQAGMCWVVFWFSSLKFFFHRDHHNLWKIKVLQNGLKWLWALILKCYEAYYWINWELLHLVLKLKYLPRPIAGFSELQSLFLFYLIQQLTLLVNCLNQWSRDQYLIEETLSKGGWGFFSMVLLKILFSPLSFQLVILQWNGTMAVLHFIHSLTGVPKEWKYIFFPKQRENSGRKAVSLVDAFAAYILWKLEEPVFCM